MEIIHSVKSSVSGEVEEVEKVLKSLSDLDFAFMFLNPDFIFGLRDRALAA